MFYLPNRESLNFTDAYSVAMSSLSCTQPVVANEIDNRLHSPRCLYHAALIHSLLQIVGITNYVKDLSRSAISNSGDSSKLLQYLRRSAEIQHSMSISSSLFNEREKSTVISAYLRENLCKYAAKPMNFRIPFTSTGTGQAAINLIRSGFAVRHVYQCCTQQVVLL